MRAAFVKLVLIPFVFLSLEVNGNYGTWSLWSECDKTCGRGTRLRFRSCSSPTAQFGGSDCTKLGPDREADVCNLVACPGAAHASKRIIAVCAVNFRMFHANFVAIPMSIGLFSSLRSTNTCNVNQFLEFLTFILGIVRA